MLHKLTGGIPPFLGNMTSLEVFSFTTNPLGGSIPDTFSRLKSLREFYVGRCNLHGIIPNSIYNLSLLTNFSLRDNQITGTLLPTIGSMLPNLLELQLWGNQLSGILPQSISNCSKLDRLDMYDNFFSGKLTIDFANLRDISYISLYNNNFSGGKKADEMRFIIDYLGNCTKLKVLDVSNCNIQGVIPTSIGVYFQGNDFKALVYEFMPNGSLHDWLHSNTNTSRLDLFQRINILIDVASTFDYLHNQCLPAVVHGDMKPSNILLDNDMVAHIGDFGLAKFFGTNSNQNSSTGVNGTIGYAPPEYGLGSEMFGILLLEVMIGKNPTDDLFNDDLSLHKFACVALVDQVIDVIDGDVVVMQSTEANAQKMEECLASTIRIGVSCFVDFPSQRMNINNVVHELLHVWDALQNLEV